MPDKYRQAVEAWAWQALANAVRQGAPGEPITVRMAGAGVEVTMTVAPIGSHLTPCQRDLLDLLAGQDRPRVLSWLLEQLEQRGLLHGESTVRHALADLVATGALVNNRRMPRGYFVPGRVGA